jgi:hypothetical protein
MTSCVEVVCFAPDSSKLPAFVAFGEVVCLQRAKVDKHKDSMQLVASSYSALSVFDTSGVQV